MNETIPATGHAVKTKSTFRIAIGVATNIQAAPDRIWELLTNASNLAKWNTTITSIEGNIAPGEKIKLIVKAAPERTFNLAISEFVPSKKLVWRDGFAPMFSGVRTYTLTPQSNGSTNFEMVEVLSGLMLPMIANSLPDFGPSFEQNAQDLKRAAEKS